MMKKVGIICGGFSSEYEISVLSAKNILENFPDGYMAHLVYMTREAWEIEVDGKRIPMHKSDLSYTLNGETQKIDLAIVYIHGDPGENGKVQAYLEMIGIPYVNSGPLASELSFDKWYCNQFLKGFGYEVADSVYLKKESAWNTDNIIEQLGLPLFVKPCDSGSSYGISRVNEKKDLEGAMNSAFDEGETVIVESFLDGVEVTCGVYRSVDGLVALPLTEIVSKNEFFDFEAKYQGLSDEITPARISKESTELVQKISKDVYELMNLRSIARIDYMMVNDVPVIIEVNTTPGFSNESIVPKMIDGAGISVKEFWTQILAAEVEH